MNQATWADYVRAVTGADNGKTIAAKTGQNESTISRWKTGANVPDPRTVVAFARAYERSPLEALIVAGYLTDAEAGVPLRTLGIQEFTDLELAQEMVRRVKDGTPHEVLEQPLDANHPAMQQIADPEN